MNIRSKYQISFYKTKSIGNTFFYMAGCENINNNSIANHLTYSDIDDAIDQINELSKALRGVKIQEDWGEVKGSQLDIFPNEGTVQVGYTNRRISISDFKGLLEEWLSFISEG